MATMKRWQYIFICDRGEVTGTNDESVAKDLIRECTVIEVNSLGEVAVLDEDMEQVEIEEN